MLLSGASDAAAAVVLPLLVLKLLGRYRSPMLLSLSLSSLLQLIVLLSLLAAPPAGTWLVLLVLLRGAETGAGPGAGASGSGKSRACKRPVTGGASLDGWLLLAAA
jgi:hypothetical protein